MSSLRHVLLPSLFTTLSFSAGISLAAEMPQRPGLATTKPEASATVAADATAKPTDATEGVKATTAETPAAPQPKTFVSDGQPFSMEELGFAITPPAAWEVSTYESTMSLVMREPKDNAPSYDKPKYQRNITVTASSNASPIDEKRAIELEASMTKRAEGDASIAQFKVIEHKFFNFRGENDGLLVYSSMDLGEYKMMQMHVLVSGQEKQFLMTYTDLADRFSDQADQNFAKAWSSMVSVAVKGETPNRQEQMIRYGSIAGGAFFLLLVGFTLRRRAVKKRYANEGDSFEDFDSVNGEGEASGSMIATLAHGWRISKATKNDANDDLLFSSHAGNALQNTKVTSFVSGF